MKTGNILRAFLALALVLIAAFSLFACGGTKDDGKQETETAADTQAETKAPEDIQTKAPDADGNVYLEDGVRLRELSVDMVGSTPNFIVILANENDRDIELDLSKFTLKKDDGTELKIRGGTKTLDANQSYTQWAIPVTEGEVNVGDKVSIFYGEELIVIAEVTDF